MNTKETLNLPLSKESESDIIANIRHIDVSGMESPYITANIHFSGPCRVDCKDCHSRELFKVVPEDNVKVKEVIDMIGSMNELGLIQGVCILGTDNHKKEEAVRSITNWARSKNLLSILYTGYDIRRAIKHYGETDWIVAGPYVGEEWYHNKQFYMMVTKDDRISYTQVTKDKYFERNTSTGGRYASQAQSRPEI
jgi:hypothetical protein